MIDGNRRGQAFDDIDVWFVHLSEELTRISAEALHVATLTFGIDGVERKAALAATRKTRQDDETVTRKLYVDVLQVVFTRSADDDLIGHGDRLFLGSNITKLASQFSHLISQTCSLLEM